jgi:hypothetical protein
MYLLLPLFPYRPLVQIKKQFRLCFGDKVIFKMQLYLDAVFLLNILCGEISL